MSHPPDGALRLPNPDARESVIRSLQTTAGKHPPGTEKYERADLAISLALSPDRAAESAPFLMRNVQRDARRILNHRPQRETFFTTIEHAASATSAAGNEPVTVEDLLPPSRHPGPVEEAQAAELEDKVRTAVTPLPNGEECFDAMLNEEAAGSTAARLDIPVHRVHRTRDYIRRRARRVLA